MTQPKHTKSTGSGRVYTIGDESWPSVTSILDHLPKPALPRWAARESAIYAVENVGCLMCDDRSDESKEKWIKEIKSAPFRQRDKKASLGSLIHSAMESYLGGRDDGEIVNELKADEVGYFYGVLHFLDSVEPQIMFTERTLVSRKYGYAGTADIIGVVNDHRTVIDLKTSKACYTSHGAQIAAYARAEYMVQDDTLTSISKSDGGMVVIVNEDGEFTAHPFDELDEWFDLFLAAQAVYNQRYLKVPGALRV